MIAQYADEVYYGVRRLFGQAPNKERPHEYIPSNPRALVDAIHSPNTRLAGAARMQKLGYGSFYNGETGASKFGASFAERELISKGKGPGGILFGRPVKGLGNARSHFGASFGKVGGPMALALGAMGAYASPRGHKMSGGISAIAGYIAFSLGDVVGTAFGGPVAGLALGSIAEHYGTKAGEAVQFLTDFNRNIKHINMGGNYEDTKVAYTMRQRAAQELGGSIMNARQYLGKEAILMHQ